MASWALAQEIVAVLTGPALADRYRITEVDVTAVLTLLGPLLPDVETDVAIRDPTNAPVVSAAVAGAATVIVTGTGICSTNRACAKWLSERGIAVVTPAQLLAQVGPP